MRRLELEERLIDFSVSIIKMTDRMQNTYSSKYFAQQLVRSGSSPALNYGEAQAGESRKDFVHKMKLVLKELRESYNCLRIIDRADLYKEKQELKELIKECNELVSIFVKSVKTAQANTSKI